MSLPNAAAPSANWSSGRLPKGAEKTLAILVILEDSLPAIPTTHDVIHRTGVLDAQLARHIRQATVGSAGTSRGFQIAVRALCRLPSSCLAVRSEEFDNLLN